MTIVNCPAPGRQTGHVRRSLDKTKWSARFKFKCRGEFKTIDCPVRPNRAEAEVDRSFVAGVVGKISYSSRMDAAEHWVKFLRDGGEPGPANMAPQMYPELIRTMTKEQLRDCASKGHGMRRNKKTSAGKWIPKTCKELRTELLVLMASRPTQALPGRQDNRKRIMVWLKKRPAASTNTTSVCYRI